MTIDPTTALYLDGTKLVEWLEAGHILGPEESPRWLHANHRTAIERWRKGSAASVFVADEVLCKLGVCLGEIPDDLWRDPPVTSGRALGVEARERIHNLRALGWSQRLIACMVGCDVKTVRTHLRKAAV